MFGLSWPETHGALTHFPVALLLTAFAFDIGAAIWRKREWRTVSFWLLVATVVSALPVLASGWIAGTGLFGGSAAPPPIFVRHRLAAFVTAALAIGLLAWRVIRRDQLAGAALFCSVLLAVLTAAAAGYTGFLGGRMVFGAVTAGPPSPNVPAAAGPSVPTVSEAVLKAGRVAYQANQCRACHLMAGDGARMGPDLTHEARRHADIAWQTAHLKDPAKIHPGSGMPSFADLPPEELNALASFLATRK